MDDKQVKLLYDDEGYFDFEECIWASKDTLKKITEILYEDKEHWNVILKHVNDACQPNKNKTFRWTKEQNLFLLNNHREKDLYDISKEMKKLFGIWRTEDAIGIHKNILLGEFDSWCNKHQRTIPINKEEYFELINEFINSTD